MKVELRPFERSQMDSIIQFAASHPWKPIWSEAFIKEFLGQLISNQNLVLDFYSSSSQERLATAVLVDRITNTGNNACLEILGISSKLGKNILEIFELAIERAKELLPSDKSGIEVTLHDSIQFQNEFFSRHGLSHYYDTFEMEHHISEIIENSDSTKVSILEKGDFREVYEVLVASFKNNPDTSIPSWEDWKNSQGKGSESVTWVIKNEGKISGFLCLIISYETLMGEIRTLGVHPSERRKGQGRILLLHALSYMKKIKLSSCHLTVATTNARALNLYQNIGFAPINHYRVFQWKRESEQI